MSRWNPSFTTISSYRLDSSGFSGVVEDERASIKNSGDVGGTTNHRDYGSGVNTALLGSPISEATNDTLEGLHLNNGYQVKCWGSVCLSQLDCFFFFGRSAHIISFSCQDTIDSSMLEDDKRNLYLYAEEIQHRPQITSVIRQLANYQVSLSPSWRLPIT